MGGYVAIVFLFSLAPASDQLATVRLEHRMTLEQCQNSLSAITSRMTKKAPSVLGQKVRAVGECHFISP